MSKKKMRVGLALSSGAARGLAHIGVIKALQEEDIRIDMIAGSSMGALVGAYFAKHCDIERLGELVQELDFKKVLKLADPHFSLLFKGFVSGKKVEDFLRIIIGDIDFRDLKIPLLVVATDINTAEEVIINTGSVIKAVRASISMPGIFTPVKIKNRFLIDGGVTNPVPVDILKSQGIDFVIASNVIGKPKIKIGLGKKPLPTFKSTNPILKKINARILRLTQENKDRFENIKKFVNNLRKTKKYKIDKDTPSIFEVLIKAIYTMEYQIAKLKASEANLVVSPEINFLTALEFYRAKEAIEAGYKKAKEILSKNKSKFLGMA
jgi:NTE family protein